MQVTDVFFGIILIGLLAWTMVLALSQNNLAVVVNNISANQQTLISDGNYCKSASGFALVRPEEINFNDYTIIPKKTQTKQLVLCVYEKQA